jgi:hypothetical protein
MRKCNVWHRRGSMEGRSQRILKTEHKAKNSDIVGMLENAGMKD